MSKNQLVAGVLLFLGVFLFLGSFKIVKVGHKGVKVRLGKVVSESLPEGIHFKIPFIEKIKNLDVRVFAYRVETLAYSRDAQIVKVLGTADIRLEGSKAHEVYKNVGRMWEEKLVQQVLEGQIKKIVGQYIAVKIISDRNVVTQKILEDLKVKLKEKNVVVKHFEVNNFDFDDQFEEAVKHKVIAIEKAKEAKNNTVRIKEEAFQKVTTAKAEAQSIRIRARALSNNAKLVELEAVEKWDGKLPEIVAGGGALPFINIKSGAGKRNER